MRIVTWNVNGVRAVAKKGLLEFIQKTDPDIFCVQESKAHPDQCEEKLIKPLGRTSYWSSAYRPGYSGTITYLKAAPVSVQQSIGIKKFDCEGRFVITEQNGFLLYNVYFPNGGSGEERHRFKQEFLIRLKEHLLKKLHSGHEIILVGDYNIAPENIDVYDPVNLANQSGFLPEERRWFGEFLADGFVDLFRHFHSNEKFRYTWWNYLDQGRTGNRGWRIDHICVSRGLMSRMKSCEILDDVTGSDHCPVTCELDA